MTTLHDRPPAGPGGWQPYPPPEGGDIPGGPGGTGSGEGPGNPFRRRRRRRVLAGAVAGAAVIVAAAVGSVGALGTGTPHGHTLSTAQIAAEVGPALVNVTSTLGYEHATSAGTGMVLTPSGEILTNNHVIEGATSITATDVGNGRTYQAVVVGYDQQHDIAVLQLRGASGLATVTMAGQSPVTVGQKVVALGNAGGRGGTPAVAAGKVTGVGESVTATDQAAGTSERLTGLIRTDAPIEPGDSGGPLLNTSGDVIGMNTAASSGFRFQSGAVQTQAYAIPASQATATAGQITSGKPSATIHLGATAFLGVQLAPGAPAGPGAVVEGVVAGSPASTAGLAGGDVIESLAGHQVSSPSDIQEVLSQYHPGDRVTIGWADQAGTSHTATVGLASGPAG